MKNFIGFFSSQSGYTILNSPQNWMTVPVYTSMPSIHIAIFFLYFSYSNRYATVYLLLVCNSLITVDVESLLNACLPLVYLLQWSIWEIFDPFLNRLSCRLLFHQQGDAGWVGTPACLALLKPGLWSQGWGTDALDLNIMTGEMPLCSWSPIFSRWFIFYCYVFKFFVFFRCSFIMRHILSHGLCHFFKLLMTYNAEMFTFVNLFFFFCHG